MHTQRFMSELTSLLGVNTYALEGKSIDWIFPFGLSMMPTSGIKSVFGNSDVWYLNVFETGWSTMDILQSVAVVGVLPVADVVNFGVVSPVTVVPDVSVPDVTDVSVTEAVGVEAVLVPIGEDTVGNVVSDVDSVTVVVVGCPGELSETTVVTDPGGCSVNIFWVICKAWLLQNTLFNSS